VREETLDKALAFGSARHEEDVSFSVGVKFDNLSRSAELEPFACLREDVQMLAYWNEKRMSASVALSRYT
jgi:hypothetical protein